MKLDEVADDRETEADAAVRARRAAVRLAKALEDVRQEIGRDADARIADDDFDVRVDALDADLHDPLFRCELHGVRNEVPHHLLQAVGIAGNRAGAGIENRLHADLLGIRSERRRLDGIPHHVRHVDRLDVQPDLPRDDARDVEDVFDNLRERRGVALHGDERL